MKTLIPIFALLCMGLVLNAQTVLLEEYFPDTIPFPPTGWTMIDADGDGYDWEIDTYEDEIYAISASYINGVGALTPDNYLITYQIDLTDLSDRSGTLTLNYSIGAASATYYAEHYEVAISTTDNQAASFTNQIFEETLTEGMGDTWTPREFDISQFLGEMIYITWRHYDCTDQYKLMLDSIVVTYDPNIAVPELGGASLRLYPNPAKDFITISGTFDEASLSIYSLTGSLLHKELVHDGKARVGVADLPEGIYFVRITTNEGTISRKLHIAR